MIEPLWLDIPAVLAIHDCLLAEHGGASGIRDLGLLESAIEKPRHLFAYGHPSLFDLAASYAFGLAKNHAFIDGNKRTAFVVAVVFLDTNGCELRAGEVDATLAMLALAASEMTEPEMAGWFRENSRVGN
ncbi:MAG TPA: type II toxin-antitoxin system death-on-curing family toxin [Candidatus Limnocylindria bacterium]|jgi:death-on-curing protein|nr:type II toxin-antitoxin system death-on-curing family toxin [Candidatus Limnocylindria bacterium]